MNRAQRLRRIGAIGDIHAEDARLETALRFLQNEKLDLIMAVGDIADGPGSVNRCCQLLQQYHVVTVRGNHERWFLSSKMRDLPEITPDDTVDDEARAFLEALPVTRVFETVAGRLLLCHGLGDDDMTKVGPSGFGESASSIFALQKLLHAAAYRFVVNGHSHRRLVRTINELTIINAGTIYQWHAPCFLVADFEAGYVQYYNLKETDDLSGVIEVVNAERIELSV